MVNTITNLMLIFPRALYRLVDTRMLDLNIYIIYIQFKNSINILKHLKV